MTGGSSSSSKERNKNSSSSTNQQLQQMNSLSQFGSLGLNSQQSVQAAMNALAASNSQKVKEYMSSSGILR